MVARARGTLGDDVAVHLDKASLLGHGKDRGRLDVVVDVVAVILTADAFDQAGVFISR